MHRVEETLDEAPDGSALILRAEQVARKATGVHGRLTAILGKRALCYSYFNLDRDEDRGRFAGRIHGRLGPLGQLWTREWLHGELDRFCYHLWPRWLSEQAPEPLSGEVRALSYVLEPYVLDGGGTIVFGGPGTGKTYLATIWARLVERGDSRLWKVERRPVLYLQLERSAQLFARRIALVNRALGYREDLPLLSRVARGQSLRDLAETLGELPQGTVVFLDSISRAGLGSLRDDDVANEIIDTLNALSSTWVALAHTSHALKDAPDGHAYGSVHFGAGADVVVQLVSERAAFDPSRRGLSLRIMPETNEIPQRPPELLEFRFDHLGLREVRRAQAADYAQLTEYAATTTERVVEALKRRGTASAEELAEETGLSRSRIAHLLSEGKQFVRVRRDRGGVVYGLRAHQDDLMDA